MIVVADRRASDPLRRGWCEYPRSWPRTPPGQLCSVVAVAGGHASISSDGRYVVFHSWSYAFGRPVQVYLYDRLTRKRTRISPHLGTGSWDPVISADGRRIVYATQARLTTASLVPGAGLTTDSSKLVVYDRRSRTTRDVSVSTRGALGNGFGPAVSANGRYVAFASATPLDDDDSSGVLSGLTCPNYAADCVTDIFRRDLVTGSTVRLSVATDGTEADVASGCWCDARGPFPHDQSLLYGSRAISISADGGVIAFQSLARNLAAGDTNDQSDIFVRVEGPVRDCASGANEQGLISGVIRGMIEPAGGWVLHRGACQLASNGF